MTAFTIFAIAVILGIFFHAFIIKNKLHITLNNLVSSLSAVLGNVSNVLSAATLLTILLEGADIMFFRRTREERAKLKQERAEIKEEKRELEELKKEISDAGLVPPNSESSNPNKTASQPPKQTQPPEQTSKSTHPSKPENVKSTDK